MEWKDFLDKESKEEYFKHLMERDTTFSLLSTAGGAVGVIGEPSQVNDIIERAKPDKYVVALNAL